MAIDFSVWEKESFFAPHDVVIVGSGFVGLWSAFFLKRKAPHLRVSIVERGWIPTGASSRNAGFACFGSLSEVVNDARLMGTDKMLELLEMRYKGLARIQKFFPDHLTNFSLCGGYELYEPNVSAGTESLQHNIAYINALVKPITGKRHTYRLADEKIGSFGFGRTQHLVENKLEGYLHAGKLLQTLLRVVQGLGVHIFNQTEVTGIERNGEGYAVHVRPLDQQSNSARHGLELAGRQVLLCTNAFTKSLIPDIDIVPARGQVLLTSPIKGLPFQGTFHSDEGYYYFRNLGNRVLLGGARNTAFEAETTQTLHTSEGIQAVLEKYLAEVVLPGYGGQYTIEQRWAGIMAMGSEKLPIVKELKEGLFCAVRMSGMGVALAPVVGQQVARLMKEAL